MWLGSRSVADGQEVVAVNRRAMITVFALLATTLAGPITTTAASPPDRDLEQARQAERGAGDAVAAAERRLAALVARTDELAEAAARAAEAYNGARFALTEAVAAERDAAADARRAAQAAERARTEFGRVAAATYRAGGQFASLGLVLEAESTDHFLDGAAALRTVTRSQGTAYQRAADATAIADETAVAAEQALADRQSAAQAAERASADAAVQVAAQEVQLAAAEREREELLDALAAARGTTVALEEERQAAMAAGAAAERERQAHHQAEREHDVANSEPVAGRSVDRDGRTDESTGGATGSAPPDSPPSAPESEPATAPAPTTAAATTSTTAPAGTSRPTPTTSSPVATRTPSPSAATTSGPRAATSSPPAPIKPSPSPTATRAPAPPVNATAAERAIAYARAQLGKPYQWGGAGPAAFDCSGLTMRAWQQGGKQLPHWSVAQARATTRVSYADLRPGDLIFWSDNGQPSGTYHVALYIGAGQMIHAPRPGKNVEVQSVFYWRTPAFYGRV
jgi:peptidoglycan DL-endopeptidase CwlO